MANIFQKMSPGIVTMASTDKNILVYDVSSLKRGIFKGCLAKRSLIGISSVVLLCCPSFPQKSKEKSIRSQLK